MKGEIERWELKWLLIVGLLALTMRLAFVFLATSKSALGPGDDDGDHISFSRTLVNEGIYASRTEGFTFVRRTWKPPLSILFIAGVFKLHGIDSFLETRLYIVFLSLLIPLGAWYLAREVWSPTIGIVSYVWACFHPSFVYYAGHIQNDSIFLVFSVWAMVLLILQKTPRQAGLTGFLMGVATLGRSQFLGISLIGFLWMLVKPKSEHKTKNSLFYMGALMLILGPWWIRNYTIYHRFVPTSSEGGYTLMVGNNPKADGGVICPPFNVPPELNEIEADRWHYQQSFRYIKENPKRTMLLGVSKLKRYWAIWPQLGGFKLRAISFATYFPMFTLALAGVWIGRKKILYMAPFYVSCIYYSGIQSIFPTVMRYRLPIEPILIVLASGALVTLVQSFSKKKLPA